MATFGKRPRTLGPRASGTAIKKASRSYESHPGHLSGMKGTQPTARVGKGSRRGGVGAKNQDLRAKM